MAAPEHSRNIVVALATLPEFLRRSMLTRRLAEFYSMPPDDQREIIEGALAAAPTIPFDDLARLLRTWLIAVCALPEDRRHHMLTTYAAAICARPERLAALHLDGMLEVLLSLDDAQREIIAHSAGQALASSGESCRAVLALLIPHNARPHVGMRSN